MELFFIINAVIIFYIFVGYPALIFLLARLFPVPVSNQGMDNYFPTVTVIIATYNEEKVIRSKIHNTLALDYPKDKLEVIICSDASSDYTDAIVNEYQELGIQLLRIEGRLGKTACQNNAVEKSKGEIIVFSDANSMYDTHAIKNLVRHFHTSSVGVVCGELRYTKDGRSNEGLYWKLEQRLKKNESQFKSCLGANGAIYAVRKNLYIPLPNDSMSDFVEPFMIYRNGFRVVYDPAAFCYEDKVSYHDEFTRKQRVILRALQSLYLMKDFLNPVRYGWYSIMFWSHKIIRWNAFVFIALLFMVSVTLVDYPYMIYFIMIQILFYLCAFLGKYSQFVVFRIPYGFMQVYSASFLAIMYWILGKKIITWKTVR